MLTTSAPRRLPAISKRQQRARRILEKGVDDGQAVQRLDPLGRLAVQLHPAFGLIEQEEQFMGRKTRNAQQSAMGKGQRTGRKARRLPGDMGRQGREIEGCHRRGFSRAREGKAQVRFAAFSTCV
jgi:hypothetical protein